MEQRGAKVAKRPAVKARTRQRCRWPVLDATQQMLSSALACFCTDPCHNAAEESHPGTKKYIRKPKLSEKNPWLTSKLARQYQQNTCLHRLHIIWAQPSSFSIGTLHIGQHLIKSLSNGIPMLSISPSAASLFVFSSHEIRGCHCNNTRE